MIADSYKDLLARFLFKLGKLCRNIIVLLRNSPAAVNKIARNQNEIAIVIFGALIEKLINYPAAFIFHSRAAVGIPIYFIVYIALKLVCGEVIMQIGGNGKFQIRAALRRTRADRERACNQNNR